MYAWYVHARVVSFFLWFVESEFELRSDSQYSDHCDLLEQENLLAADLQHYSLVYGIKDLL